MVEGSGATRKLTKRDDVEYKVPKSRPRSVDEEARREEALRRKNEERGAYYLCLVQRRKQ